MSDQRIIVLDGVEHQFPADATDDEIRQSLGGGSKPPADNHYSLSRGGAKGPGHPEDIGLRELAGGEDETGQIHGDTQLKGVSDLARSAIPIIAPYALAALTGNPAAILPTAIGAGTTAIAQPFAQRGATAIGMPPGAAQFTGDLAGAAAGGLAGKGASAIEDAVSGSGFGKVIRDLLLHRAGIPGRIASSVMDMMPSSSTAAPTVGSRAVPGPTQFGLGMAAPSSLEISRSPLWKGVSAESASPREFTPITPASMPRRPIAPDVPQVEPSARPQSGIGSPYVPPPSLRSPLWEGKINVQPRESYAPFEPIAGRLPSGRTPGGILPEPAEPPSELEGLLRQSIENIKNRTNPSVEEPFTPMAPLKVRRRI